MNIWTIPHHVPFLKSLIAGLFEKSNHDLEEFSKIQILLPSRRACKNLKDVLLNYFDGNLLLMPDIRALGDLDLDELSLKATSSKTAEIISAINPTIDPVRRQCILAKMIFDKTDLAPSHEQALLIAAALGRFLDDMTTEGVAFDDLNGIIPDQYAHHWQKTLHFLNILNDQWPKWLQENGLIESADKRNLLLNAWADLWATTPPTNPVYIAGVTGTIPAAATLMKTVASLTNGGVILPGFDVECDDDTWKTMQADHPYHGFKTLLDHLEITKDQIKIWSYGEDPKNTSSLDPVLREIMRPSESSDLWFTLNKENFEAFKETLENITYLKTKDELEEAQLVAIKTRALLEDPKKTITIVTANRNLARHISSKMKRWGLDIDDSAGIPLHQSDIGRWLLLIAQAATKTEDQALFLSLLKHQLTHLDDHAHLLKDVANFEKNILRAAPDYESIEEENSVSSEDSPSTEIYERIETIKTELKSLNSALKNKTLSFDQILEAHLKLAEKIGPKDIKENITDGTLSHDDDVQSLLWRGDDGETAAHFLSRLLTTFKKLDQNDHPKIQTPKSYITILRQFMSGVNVRSKFGTHPRVQILGLMESRLHDSDVFFLCGLNEGMWPPSPPSDPFLSRHMRMNAGLPSPDKMIGLAAHDFISKLGSGREIYISNSQKEGSSPANPSRFIVRLNAILEKLEAPLKTDTQLLKWAQQIDETQNVLSAKRPEPKPPLPLRAIGLSASDVALWMRDPYGLYAKRILKLKKLEPINKQISFAERGQFIHRCMEKWVKETLDGLNETALDRLLEIGAELLPTYCPDASIQPFWQHRFEELAREIVSYEREWRTHNQPIIIEEFGECYLSATDKNGKDHRFRLYAKADRIDQNKNDQSLSIIDYKSGTKITKNHVTKGLEPQLAVEAIIAQNDGYKSKDGISIKAPIGLLTYWILSKASDFGNDDITNKKTQPEAIIENAHKGLTDLFRAFLDEDMPYLAIPNEDYAPKYNDYEHLSRYQEWGQSS